jgi:hypothetical protein
MDDKLYDILLKLPRKNLIHLMWDALDYMQGYNGRSKQECILEAIGAELVEIGKDNDEYKYKIQSLAEAKRNTEQMGL